MTNSTLSLLSPEELEAVRKEFGCAIGRRGAVRLLMKLGFSPYKAKLMLSGSEPVLTPLPERSPRRWSREMILNQFNTVP